jgi:phosphoribosylformylglycinamidine synthase subunit PurQ / glutaminase
MVGAGEGEGMSRPRVCVITGFGINADEELVRAFDRAGGSASRVHVTDLIARPGLLSEYRVIAFPGGFSFGDHLGSGKVFATLFSRNLGDAMKAFLAGGGLAIGVCNGFQVLVKMGILPDLGGTGEQEVSLIHNDSGRYEDRWIKVRSEKGSRCLWTRDLPDMDLPVRHGEGKFITRSPGMLAELEGQGCIALRYVASGGGEPSYPEDPNGSEGHVAGICDRTGRVFGLMPHPEAFVTPLEHPDFATGRVPEGLGLRIFTNGVRAAAGT